MFAAAVLAANILSTTIVAKAGGSDLDAVLGKALFERIWVSAPASTKSADGLGPLYNARSCTACHPGGDGGIFDIAGNGKIIGDGLILRLGNIHGNNDPVYGQQLQNKAIQGHIPEGAALMTDPTTNDEQNRGYQLNSDAKPAFRAVSLSSGPMSRETMIAGRRAPSLLGVGLFAHIPDAAILALADPEDSDGDGISGRVNYVADGDGVRSVGRFGWKASQPTLPDQIAQAFSIDMGLSSPRRANPSGDCTEQQLHCLNAPNGADARTGDAEITSRMMDLLEAFLGSLPPPRQARELSLDGVTLFENTGCTACHTPSLGAATIFSDLLLHDMGDGLADNIAEGSASGREWRTAPLWGLGARLAGDHGYLLHDGRTNQLSTAIKWHDGEARYAKEKFLALNEGDKARLLRFLGNL